MNPIPIISYNCQSFLQNIDFIRVLLSDCELLLLQETLLPEHSFGIADSLNDESHDFEFSFVSSSRNDDCFTGRSSGRNS